MLSNGAEWVDLDVSEKNISTSKRIYKNLI